LPNQPVSLSSTRGRRTPAQVAVLFSSAIFLSAFLLFSVEPLIAKKILPWFGGSAAVWATCLVFYQSALLAGYVYARLVVHRLRPGVQFGLHICLLLLCLACLPIGPGAYWGAASATDPAWQILVLLTASIGLPFVALSATNPLLQDWLARTGNRSPYRLFALSNFASLAALILYPIVIEPWFDIHKQRLWWSGAFVLFAVLCASAAGMGYRSRGMGEDEQVRLQPNPRPARTAHRFAWFALAACGSMLLLSVTNHLDQNVAAVPLLWVLPLAVYLLTFIFSFGSRLYQRSLWSRLLAFALGMLGYATYNINTVEAVEVSVPIFLAGLFICCLFCHGELNRLRPEASALTGFYLMIAAGGAAGSILIGLIAPRIFSGVYELPVALLLTALLALALEWNNGHASARILWTGVAACMVAVVIANVQAYHEDTLTLRRSFYGSLRVVQSPHAGPQQHRTLFHGTIQHGAQFLLPPRRMRPTTYYGPDSGIGIVLRECFDSPKRVGIVGLGTGTIAAYGQPGDTFRFYEINHQIVEIAESLFYYLRESHARIEIAEGDARLSLEHDTSPPFDVLAADAFSGDAIPVHLLTREAFALYMRHLKRDGVLAFHVSNDYLDLAPVVAQLAREIGYRAVLVKNHEDHEDLILPADWVLVTRNVQVLQNPAVQVHAKAIDSRPYLQPWTDGYNNLVQILKIPQMH